MGRVHGPGIRHRTRSTVAHGVRPTTLFGQMGGVGRAERPGPRSPVAQARHRTRSQGRSTSGGKTGAVEMLEAYCAGVNAFIETTYSLPVEYRILDATPEPWSPWHCLAAYKVRNLIYGVWEMKLWRARLANEIGPEAAAKLFRGYEDRASDHDSARRIIRWTGTRGTRRPYCGSGTPGRSGVRRRGQQRVGYRRRADGVRNAAGRRRLSPRTGHAECLLPGTSLVSRVARERLLPARRARSASLQPHGVR